MAQHRYMKIRLAALFAAFGAAFAPISSFAADPVKGAVVLSSITQAQSQIIWDATDRVTELTGMKLRPGEGQRALEADAVRLLAARAPGIKSKRLTVRVVYVLSRQALMYGNPAMADKGPLLEVSAATADASRQAVSWIAAVENGNSTPGLMMKPLGEFPTTY